jgi:2-polyprenyl-3-methyl-5-hydroxy-6-metoxy-1,4-benzoquinol methylase
MLDISGDPYRHLAAVYDALGFSELGLLCLQTVLSNLPAPPGGKAALDIGCGTGKVAITLAKANWKVIGLDLSPAMVSMARLNALEAQTEVDFVRGDLLALTGDSTYNLITAFSVLTYLRNPDAFKDALHALAARLKPNGILAFDLPTPQQLQAVPPSEARIAGNLYFLQTAQWNAESRMLVRRLVWFRSKTGSYEKQESSLTERGVTREEMKSMITHARLETISITEFGTSVLSVCRRT